MKLKPLCYTIICLLISCNSDKGIKTQTQTVVRPKANEFTVETSLAQLKNFNYIIQGSGKIKPTYEQKYYSEFSNIIKHCDASNNKIYNKGSKLLEFDVRSLEIRILKIKESIFNMRMNYLSDILSQESLLVGKSTGIKDTVYRKIKANVGLTNSEFELKELQHEKRKSMILAPFNGKLARVKIQKGQQVKAGDELFTIYSFDDLYVEAKILETDIDLLRIGQEANIYTLSSNQIYKSDLIEVDPLVDENGLINVKLHLRKNKDLMPGMNSSVSIYVPTKKSLVVPKSSVVMIDGKKVIFTVENNLAKWNEVILGKDNGREVEVREGLKDGDIVITRNNSIITHGSSVIISDK
jgi:RND family efflux transporter MFP subunit